MESDDATPYPPIVDWSVEGRRELMERHRQRIRTLLDLAFTEFYDRHELSRWGLRDDDPVLQAVDWCVARFTDEKPIDPGRLHAGSASFRLFTQPDWWLAQKVTTAGNDARKAFSLRMDSIEELPPGYSGGGPESSVAVGPGPEGRGTSGSADSGRRAEDRMAEGLDVIHFPQRLRRTLIELLEATAPDLVGYWLEGTERWRAWRFDWPEEASGTRPDLAGKTRSFLVHDAMFRFQCLFHGLLSSVDELLRPATATMFQGVPNTPPYRVPDRLAGPRLGLATRATTKQRKAGCARLLELLLGRLDDLLPEDLAAELVITSIGPTTLWALGINDREQLRGLLDLIMAGKRDG